MANYVYIATSLDGFIATADGGIDWLNEIPNPDQSDFGFAEFMDGIDALVMGRNSFDKVMTFDCWPYDKPVFVLSNRMTEVPEGMAGKVKIVNGDINELVHQLHQQGYNNLYIDGGTVIQSFLREDLIDELIITRVPIILGDGIPLFGKHGQMLTFKHRKTEIFNNMLVKSSYVRNK